MLKQTLAPLLAAALLVVVLSSPTAAQQPNFTTNPEWQRYEVGKGSFSVLLPTKPSETRETTPGSEKVIATDMYLYVSASNGMLLVAQVTFLDKVAESWSEVSVQNFYQGVWKGLREGLDAQLKKSNISGDTKLIEEKRVTFAGSKGYEFSFVSGQRYGRVLVTLVGSRAFAGMILGTDKIGDQLQERFFGSFVILPGKTSKLDIPQAGQKELQSRDARNLRP